LRRNERNNLSAEETHEDINPTEETHEDTNPTEETHEDANPTVDTRKERQKSIPREKRTRKMDQRPKTWIASKAKTGRNLGLAYTTVRGVDKPAKEMLKGCDASCRLSCGTRISEADRLKLLQEFWKMGDYQKQLEYFAKRAKVFDKATGKDKEDSARKYSRTYTFKINGVETKVCKFMSLRTLGLSCDSGITTALRKQGEGSTLSPEKGGKSTDSACNTLRRKKKEDLTETVADHINSIQRVPSHLCRSSIPDREYFPEELLIPILFEMYTEKMQEIGRTENTASLRQYREIFHKNFNISFHMPKKEERDVCYALREASPEHREELEILR